MAPTRQYFKFVFASFLGKRCRILFKFNSSTCHLGKESLDSSVTRLGDFGNAWAKKFNTIVAQILGNFCALLRTITFYVKTAVTAFCTTFEKKLATFYSNNLVTLLARDSSNV